MMRRKGLGPRLKKLHRKFENWRQTKKGKQRIPEILWNAAIRLAKTKGYSIHQVAKALRLNQTDLKRRIEAAGGGTGSGRSSQPTFVEMDFPMPVETADCIIELENSSGAKMRISLKGQNRIDLKALSDSFWSRK